jgi:hypothetical protein
MPGPPRSDAQVQAFADAYNAGASAVEAAASIGQQSGSGSRLKADAIARGMIDPGARDWKPIKRTTACNADGDVTATFLQEKPDTGATEVRELPGFAVSRRTTHRVGGEVTQTWEQERPDGRQVALAIEAAGSALALALPRAEPVPPPLLTNALLCNVYTISDFHMGMLAWHREGGADWDIPIATATLRGAFGQMVASAPAADTCVIAQLGDMMHYDGMVAATPTSGHPLDADGRFSKMVGATLYVLRAIIDHALSRHRKVVLLMAEGNHDIASSVWLRHMFKALYENEPRVEVIDSELPYYAYRFGNVMLGWHHSHLSKMETLPGIFSSQFREMWGQCPRVYLHTGHMHHRKLKEDSGAIVEQHPTLAARDAYSARGGYQAERAAIGITYHAEFGEVGRNTVRPEMLAA